MPGPKRSLRVKRQRPIKQAVARIERRGGARIGAGRKPGTKSFVKRHIAIREVTQDIIRAGKLPLRVMINNMVHYDEQAAVIEEKLAELLAEASGKVDAETLTKMLELFAQASDTRMKAQKCASDAAPFLHPRLSAISLDVNQQVHPRDLPVDASTEQLREDFRRLRSAPYDPSATIATDESGDPIEAEILEPEPESA